MKAFPYCTDVGSLLVCTAGYNKKCGYCKRGQEKYDRQGLTQDGFCVDAMSAIYPYFLALLYDAKFSQGSLADEGVLVSCPNAHSPTLIRVSFKYKKLRLLLNILEKFFRCIGFPKDAIDKIMIAQIMNENEECCHRLGSLFMFKIPDIRQLCPASFFSLYPFIHLYARDKNVERLALNLACPDPKSNINYLASPFAKKSQSPETQTMLKPCCFYDIDLSKYKILAQDGSGEEVTLDQIFPVGLCPTLMNVAIPYIITFQKGGYFKWREDIHTVEAQCPNSSDRVAFEIRRDPSGIKPLSLVIKKVRGMCPKAHREGETYRFDFSKIVCPHLLLRLFPYLLFLELHPEREKYASGILLEHPLQVGLRYLLKRAV
ncbi:MAG: hypothetical protein AMJ95_00375 [Omnitrophica WOR_2 bacterium SM23_72]|nr:MAG: hypothetical protein AMJ95_00375 [Omnitrophica WOR_2 bacterium SM23_72]